MHNPSVGRGSLWEPGKQEIRQTQKRPPRQTHTAASPLPFPFLSLKQSSSAISSPQSKPSQQLFGSSPVPRPDLHTNNHKSPVDLVELSPTYMATESPAAADGAGAGRGRRILVAVDESEESVHALAWCLANVVASPGADTVVLVHARRPRPVYAAMDSAGYMMTSDVLASVERHANSISAAAVTKAKAICADHPHVKVETVVESGDPRDVICEATDKMAADLLVMGSHGYGFIQRAFLGSVSNHCAQNCKCPVLIVKRPKE